MARAICSAPRAATCSADQSRRITGDRAAADPASGALITDPAGNLFGVSTKSVFEISSTGAFTVLQTFLVANPALLPDESTPLGSGPVAPLYWNDNGDILGTTSAGGKFGYGTVFKIAP